MRSGNLLILLATCFAFPIWPGVKEFAQKMIGTPGEQLVYDLARASFEAA